MYKFLYKQSLYSEIPAVLACGPFVEVAVLIMAETLSFELSWPKFHSSHWNMGVGVKLTHVDVAGYKQAECTW